MLWTTVVYFDQLVELLFFSRFQPFLSMLNLFQWSRLKSTKNIWKWTKKCVFSYFACSLKLFRCCKHLKAGRNTQQMTHQKIWKIQPKTICWKIQTNEPRKTWRLLWVWTGTGALMTSALHRLRVTRKKIQIIPGRYIDRVRLKPTSKNTSRINTFLTSLIIYFYHLSHL